MSVAERLAKGGCQRDCQSGRQGGRWAGQIGVGMSGCFDALSFRSPETPATQIPARMSSKRFTGGGAESKRRAVRVALLLPLCLSFFPAPPASSLYHLYVSLSGCGCWRSKTACTQHRIALVDPRSLSQSVFSICLGALSNRLRGIQISISVYVSCNERLKKGAPSKRQSEQGARRQSEQGARHMICHGPATKVAQKSSATTRHGTPQVKPLHQKCDRET
jgi:hypothetical protein